MEKMSAESLFYEKTTDGLCIGENFVKGNIISSGSIGIFSSRRCHLHQLGTWMQLMGTFLCGIVTGLLIASVFLLALIEDNGNTSVSSNGSFHLASYYASHMVLQKAPARALIWGYAQTADSVVQVHFKNSTYIAHAFLGVGDVGWVWTVSLPPTPPGGPHTIKVNLLSKPGQTILLQDVMFGDVWLCSGQSNMQFRVAQIFNSSAEFADSLSYPDIRVFSASRVPSNNPLSDLKSVDQQWARASPKSLGQSDPNIFSSVCWLFAKYTYPHLKPKPYPLGLIECDWGGTPIRVWAPRNVDAICHEPEEDSPVEVDDSLFWLPRGSAAPPHKSAVLWNAMIHPLANMTIYGALWYQGENDGAGNPNHYNCTFPHMIDAWRSHFHTSSGQQTDRYFPFGFVQLGPRALNHSVIGGFPVVRWHQTADRGFVPNDEMMQRVFMSTAVDLEDPHSPYGSVHIRDKQTVAHRLSLTGRAIAYGEQTLHYQYATPINFTLHQHSLNITFSFPSVNRLKLRSKHGFDVLCQRGASGTNTSVTRRVWSPSNIRAILDHTVVVTPACSPGYRYAGVRYLWRETPCAYKMCALYTTTSRRTRSHQGVTLPVPPFVHPPDIWTTGV